MQQPSIGHTTIIKYDEGIISSTDDFLAIEEPLEIQIAWYANGANVTKSISVTMRTPGCDTDLALGFLFTEGIIDNYTSIEEVAAPKENTLLVRLKDGIEPRLNNSERNFYISSSCGVCGKASVEAIKTYCEINGEYPYDQLKYTSETLLSLPQRLRSEQSMFDKTGGIHACALFNTEGDLLFLREDVGRHNALDKLIGTALQTREIPLDEHLLLLSGRASFELVQKSAMAGIKIIAAVGAPSSLAVQMAEEYNITLIGFLRGRKFNIYSGAQRVVNL